MTRQHHPDDVAAVVKGICAAREKCGFPDCSCEDGANIASEEAIPILTAIAEAQERRGLVLVPMEPTSEMVTAAERAHGLWEGFLAENGWRTMIAARPT